MGAPRSSSVRRSSMSSGSIAPTGRLPTQAQVAADRGLAFVQVLSCVLSRLVAANDAVRVTARAHNSGARVPPGRQRAPLRHFAREPALCAYLLHPPLCNPRSCRSKALSPSFTPCAPHPSVSETTSIGVFPVCLRVTLSPTFAGSVSTPQASSPPPTFAASTNMPLAGPSASCWLWFTSTD